MKLVFRLGLAAAMQAWLMLPAIAQWQGAAGIGERQVTNSEYDKAGRRLVRETGWLPGAALTATFQTGRATWFAGAEIWGGDIGYLGQTQAGAAAQSRTAMGLALLRAGGAYAFGANYSASAAIEWERARRDIVGIAGAAGLQEKTRTTRLVAGVGKAWHPEAGAVAVDGAIVLAAPERLHVEFSGLLDPASLRTRSSQGIRIGAGIRPAFAPWLELRSRFDWIRVGRSDDAAVTLAGQFRGTIAQPEHQLRAFTVTAAAVF